jgi:lambda family phage tail tape measure protein
MSAFGNSGFGSMFGGFFGMGGGTGTAIPFARGGVFANDNMPRFANGGAFTNSIVSRPTVFPFAKGVGLMGEAGPEAIMPLRRTADGRLGVAGMGGGGTTFAPVTNITVQGNADQNTVAVLKAELDRRDERMRQELPRLVTGARRDRTLKSA